MRNPRRASRRRPYPLLVSSATLARANSISPSLSIVHRPALVLAVRSALLPASLPRERRLPARRSTMADRQPRTEHPRDSTVSSPRSSTDSRSPPVPNPSKRLSHISSSTSQHRLSFTDGLRGVPPSPRARRQPSLTQSAIQSLIDHPPVRNPADPAFAGRDWRQICIGELVSPDDLRFVELDTSIEDATTVWGARPVALCLSEPC
ncbi:hypothetical protein VTN02DRAFT_1530 [Thermoascus thermophilus]